VPLVCVYRRPTHPRLGAVLKRPRKVAIIRQRDHVPLPAGFRVHCPKQRQEDRLDREAPRHVSLRGLSQSIKAAL
jgi:hypothetical protein